MRISLDFDETFTKDPILWKEFIQICKYRGHEIKFVTFRYPTENYRIEVAAKALGIEIIYTSRKPKRDFYKADIWIDDMPETICRPQGVIKTDELTQDPKDFEDEHGSSPFGG